MDSPFFKLSPTISPVSDIVGEIINRAYNEEQSIPDLSLGNQFANNILVGLYQKRVSKIKFLVIQSICHVAQGFFRRGKDSDLW